MKQRLGVCCLLVGDKKSNFKTLRLNRTRSLENKRENVFSIYRHNLRELSRVIDYLLQNDILLYRIGSSMFPLADHPEFHHLWEEFCGDESNWTLAKQSVSNFIQRGGRLSTHPDQFCVVSSSNEIVNLKSVINLEYHAKMFDMLGIPRSYFYPINIHVSNGKDCDLSAKAVHSNLPLLSDSVRSRLVFETEDKAGWTYQNIIKHFPGVPVTLDYHHRLINNQGETVEQAHHECAATWGNTRPLFHHSEGKSHSLDRSHSDYIMSLPGCAVGVDIEIEAKQKNLAVLQLMAQSK